MSPYVYIYYHLDLCLKLNLSINILKHSLFVCKPEPDTFNDYQIDFHTIFTMHWVIPDEILGI